MKRFVFPFSVLLDYHNGVLQLLEKELNNNTNSSMGMLKTLINELASREVSILQVISSNTGVITLTEKDCSWIEQLCQASIIENKGEAFINANTTFTFDFEYVQSQIIRTYLLLCPINYRHIVQKYQCHTRRLTNTSGPIDIDGLDLDGRYRVPLSEGQIEKEWSYLKVMPLDKLYHAYGLLRQIALTLKNTTVDERVSTDLFTFLQSTDHDDDLRQRLEQYEVNNFPLCHLYHVIKIYAELIHGFSHLFSNVSSLLQVPLDSRVNEQLTQQLHQNLIQSDDDDGSTDMIQARIIVITLLLTDLSGVEDSLLQQATQPLVRTCEYLAIESDLLQWIPEEVRCEHYVPLSIHLIRLRSNLQERKVNIEEKVVKRWEEQSHDRQEKREERFQPYSFPDPPLTTFDTDLSDQNFPVEDSVCTSSRLFELRLRTWSLAHRPPFFTSYITIEKMSNQSRQSSPKRKGSRRHFPMDQPAGFSARPRNSTDIYRRSSEIKKRTSMIMSFWIRMRSLSIFLKLQSNSVLNIGSSPKKTLFRYDFNFKNKH